MRNSNWMIFIIAMSLTGVNLQAHGAEQSPARASTSAAVQSREPAASAKVKKTKRKTGKQSSSSSPKSTRKESNVRLSTSGDELKEAQRLLDPKVANYHEASMRLFSLTRSPRYADQRMKIKYLLGLVLMDLKLYQAAAYQFVDVARNGEKDLVKKSLTKLSVAADYLGDDSMLRYAIGKIEVGEFPQAHQDMLYYRLGQFWMDKKQFKQAAQSYANVQASSPFYTMAKYEEGLSYAELNETDRAIGAFEELINAREDKKVTDSARVAALAGKARVYYQQKDWERSIAAYREVPRDTDLWHDALFESSWAMLRAARFRSALSNFQSLHSDYYSDFYLPESLLLRATVYLYICKYDEMEKVVSLFKKVYAPIYNQLVRYLKSHSDPQAYFREIMAIHDDYDNLANNNDARKKLGIPFLVARRVLRENDFRRMFNYYQRLTAERKRIDTLPVAWRKSALGTMTQKALAKRMANTERTLGRMTRAHMRWVVADLRDLNEQNEFLTFEMLNGKKESIKKTMAGKGVVKEKESIDESADRDFYVQNGYEYWPFRGEYWLDEIGNYHYLGVQSCE